MSGEPQTTNAAEACLPTLDKLGIHSKSLVDTVDPLPIAEEWLRSFAKSTAKATLDIQSLVSSSLLPSSFKSTFLDPDAPDLSSATDTEPGVYWKDILALTWDTRTFEGSQKIQTFLEARLAQANIRNVKLKLDEAPPALQAPFPDIVWIQLLFTFDTDVGGCMAVVRLVPTSTDAKSGTIEWKAITVFTRLESLHGVEENLGPGRKVEFYQGRPWDEARAEKVAFKEKDPEVLIIGAGQSGLSVAAHLQVLGVDSLIVEKSERVGDNWRKRYEALCLHDPVWYGHLPFIPFPKTWPIYAPARKLANWLESYVDTLDLNVWTSSTVTRVEPSTAGDENPWSVTVVSKRQSGSGGNEGNHTTTTRVFHVKHVVFASGWHGGKPYIPTIPGKEKFRGEVLHSFQHDKPTDHLGKKVVVVGACTSAFDLSASYAEKGIDVTMYQRKSTYIISAKGLRLLLGGLYSEDQPYSTETSDRLNLSLPSVLGGGLSYRTRKIFAELDKDILGGLENKGFRLNKGYKDTGILFLVWMRGGGYYIDVGGSQYIIDGRIKLKADSGAIQEFTETGLKFDDGSELQADVVVFCTGMSSSKDALSEVLDQEIVDKCSPIWGLDKEGEIRGCFRELGPRGLWSMMGNLAVCRMQSKHVALQIKAIESGVFGDRYTV